MLLGCGRARLAPRDPATGGMFWAERRPLAAGANALVSLLSGQWYCGE